MVFRAPATDWKPSRAGLTKKVNVAPVYLPVMLGGCVKGSQRSVSRSQIPDVPVRSTGSQGAVGRTLNSRPVHVPGQDRRAMRLCRS